MDGQLTGEEYSENMKANYRYYNWNASEDSTCFIHINLKESEDGIYRVSGYNSSGFLGSEAAELYLDAVQAEAQERDKAAAANMETSDLQVEIHSFSDRDHKIPVSVAMPAEGWNYKDVSGKARLYHHPTETSFNYGGGIEIKTDTDLSAIDSHMDSYENYTEIGTREIGGITMQGRTYQYIGYDWTEYVGQLPTGETVSVAAVDLDCSEGTAAGNIIDSIKFNG